MTGIYKITNPKGKIYVGQSINITERINYYKTLNCKPQIKLYNSLKKYGWENHTSLKFKEKLKELVKQKLNK